MCVFSPSQQGNGDISEDMVSIIKEHLGHCRKLLQLFLTLKGLYLELCIMCFQALHRGAAGFILTLQFGRISKSFLPEIQAFVVYFRKTWIEHQKNQYETIMQGGPQTNNMLESYNRMINSLVGAKTNVWDFLKLVISHGKQTHDVSFCLTLSVRTSVETQAGSRLPWTTFKG